MKMLYGNESNKNSFIFLKEKQLVKANCFVNKKNTMVIRIRPWCIYSITMYLKNYSIQKQLAKANCFI
ncbi:hypothetical protein COJ60_15025 [Bacillus cereus]|nr:hypothetical protein CK938_10760 [Bacillus cereus]OJE17725.1 hypothetical protein BAQ46_27600 [Bacillus paranthracis]KMP65682.1 hypothetical protein TU61_19140 [Bacillus cereus]KXI83033.1 hypothetical protein ACS52_01785 [Bacillus cereus]KXY10831.1 hypothetical protein AT271_03040 [Bacillus cereus]